jgi:hypothetical protein
MSASNIHDNIFELFAGVTRSHMEKVMSDSHPDEYSIERWAERVSENDIWASDLLWNAADLTHYVPMEHYKMVKRAIANAIVNNDPVGLGQIYLGFMHQYIEQALKERREANNED